jgi:glycosyltransferase involved in cell wall biosynthesis
MKAIMDRRAEFSYENTGMGRYSAMMWQFLKQTIPSQWQIQSLNQLKMKKTDCFFWENIMEESISVKNEGDIFFAPNNGIGNYKYKNYNGKVVVTIHDIIPYIMEKTVGAGYKKIFFEQMPRILEKADHIIAVSYNTKQDLIEFCGVNEEKITVIHEGVDLLFRPLPEDQIKSCLEKYYEIDFPYIFYVGGFSGRKNVAALLEAFSKAALDKNLYLLLVGKPSPNTEILRKQAQKLKILEKIIWLTDVPLEYLPILYNGAELFVYPSLYEGFGLPLLEAMACGTPVIAGNNSSIPEVVGKGGILVDTKNSDDLAFAMEYVLSSKKDVDTMISEGLLRSTEFSWRKTAEKTWKVFEKVVKFADR